MLILVVVKNYALAYIHVCKPTAFGLLNRLGYKDFYNFPTNQRTFIAYIPVRVEEEIVVVSNRNVLTHYKIVIMVIQIVNLIVFVNFRHVNIYFFCFLLVV